MGRRPVSLCALLPCFPAQGERQLRVDGIAVSMAGGTRCMCVVDMSKGGGQSISNSVIVTGGKAGDIAIHDFRYIASGGRRSTLQGKGAPGEGDPPAASKEGASPRGSRGSQGAAQGAPVTSLGPIRSDRTLWYIPKAHAGEWGLGGSTMVSGGQRPLHVLPSLATSWLLLCWLLPGSWHIGESSHFGALAADVPQVEFPGLLRSPGPACLCPRAKMGICVYGTSTPASCYTSGTKCMSAGHSSMPEDLGL